MGCMLEKPHPDILNRERGEASAREHYARQLELLRDLANYGSNLLVRAWNTGAQQLQDIVVCGVLLKQVVAMIDAVEVLLTAGCSHAAFLPARAAFEASLYADWIFLGNGERKAMCYVVRNYRDERLWASRVISGTVEEEAFSRIANTLGVDVHANRPTLAQEAVAHLAEVNRILSQPQLEALDAEFTRKKGKRKTDPEWFMLEGVKSIREIADAVGRIAEYEFFYSMGSRVTHTGSYKDHICFSNSAVRLKPIRHVFNTGMLLDFAVSSCLGTYLAVIRNYRPAELKAFSKKYSEDWREPFQTQRDV